MQKMGKRTVIRLMANPFTHVCPNLVDHTRSGPAAAWWLSSCSCALGNEQVLRPRD